MRNLIKKCEHLPVGAIATAVGLATLSNVYHAQGFVSVRYVTMILMMFIWIGAFIKLTIYHEAFWADYSKVVPSTLYATFTMLTMILGNFILGFSEGLGKAMWFSGLALHILHLIIFSYRNILKGINRETFVPSWFVSFAGILVAVVVGAPKEMPWLLTGLMYYAFLMYVILFPAMIYRMVKYPIPPQFAMTRIILIAPASLVFVGYLNAFPNVNIPFSIVLYTIVFVILMYAAIKIPGFLAKPFNPGHAALTFPTAIGLVATMRMSGFLSANGFYTASTWLGHFFGIQLWLTTAIILYVGFGFLKMFADSYKEERA